jgi:hypothetical protein
MTREILYTGDVVRHTNSHRVGVVLEVGRTHPDGTVEYRVLPVPRSYDYESDDRTWWNSRHVERDPLRRSDPYRRYLALCAFEDDHARQVARATHRNHGRVRRFGGWISEQVWDTMYWRLNNRRQLLPSGEHVSITLGREHWRAAAMDCLDRRKRAGDYWMDHRPVPPGVQVSR